MWVSLVSLLINSFFLFGSLFLIPITLQAKDSLNFSQKALNIRGSDMLSLPSFGGAVQFGTKIIEECALDARNLNFRSSALTLELKYRAGILAPGNLKFLSYGALRTAFLNFNDVPLNLMLINHKAIYSGPLAHSKNRSFIARRNLGSAKENYFQVFESAISLEYHPEKRSLPMVSLAHYHIYKESAAKLSARKEDWIQIYFLQDTKEIKRVRVVQDDWDIFCDF